MIPRWGGGTALVGTIGPGAMKTLSRNAMSSCRVHRQEHLLEAYKLTNTVLGTGISGAVHVAEHRYSKQMFAIKTLSLQNVSAKKAAMLQNEVSIYLKLDHPNIVKLIDVYEEEQAVHLVMELCQGGELYDRLAAKKRYSEGDATRVTVQMLEAISYCHYHRICHRDLKLENWVYAGKGEDDPLKLIDFGFSRIFNPGIPMTAMHGTVYYVSPEVMDGCYKEKCDIWSVGVIVYMLLSGSPPFNGTHDHEILIKVKRGEYSIEGPRWNGVSDQAKDFIKMLLVKDPDERCSAAEALKHPWLTSSSNEKNELDVEVLTQMRQFALGNVLKRAALGIVAMTMTPQEAREVESQFKALDTTSSGTIQLHELAAVLTEKLNLTEHECQRIFTKIDQSGDREVHYSEFMASIMGVRLAKDKQLIREAFRRFDLENNGYITVENLRAVLGDSFTGMRVEDIVKSCDTTGNNVIDYEEFLAAMLSEDRIAESASFVEATPVCDTPPLVVAAE